MRIAVLGTGAVGARTARQLHSMPEISAVLVGGHSAERVDRVLQALADRAEAVTPDPDTVEADAVVVAHGGDHADTVTRLVRRGVPAVSTSGDLHDVLAMLDLDAEARERGVRVVPGAAFSPGFSCLLAAVAAGWLDEVDEVELARVGAGGPACAKAHHRAFRSEGWEWQEGWTHRSPGSGRRLKWFPDPVGAVDCYHAALAEAVLVTRAMPGVTTVTARAAANRRDRLTARLPMLRPPHPEGLLGGVVVAVRGRRDGQVVEHTLGAVDRPAVAAGAVAAVAARAIAGGELPAGVAGLADRDHAPHLVADLAERGVKAAVRDPLTA